MYSFIPIPLFLISSYLFISPCACSLTHPELLHLAADKFAQRDGARRAHVWRARREIDDGEIV